MEAGPEQKETDQEAASSDGWLTELNGWLTQLDARLRHVEELAASQQSAGRWDLLLIGSALVMTAIAVLAICP